MLRVLAVLTFIMDQDQDDLLWFVIYFFVEETTTDKR